MTSARLWLEKVAHLLLSIAAAVTIYSLDLHILLCLGTIYISICHPRVEAISGISHDVRIKQESENKMEVTYLWKTKIPVVHLSFISLVRNLHFWINHFSGYHCMRGFCMNSAQTWLSVWRWPTSPLVPRLSCDCRKYLPPCQPQNRYSLHCLCCITFTTCCLSVFSLVLTHVP